MEIGQGFFVVEPDGLGDKAFDNADVFIEFLKRLIKNAGREIFLIVDRGSAHRATKAGAFAQLLGREIALVLSASPCAGPQPRRVGVEASGRFHEEGGRSTRDPQNDARKIVSFLQKPSLKHAA
jgi:hypothetical protein